MKPYYQDERTTIYHGDCLEVLAALSVSPDAVIADPPYNVGLRYGSSVDDNRDDYMQWCNLWFSCLHPKRCTLISPGISNVGAWWAIKRPDWVLCWHKPAAMSRSCVGFSNWEPVLLYGSVARKSNDVFTAIIKPDQSLNGHPCPKPLAFGKSLVQMATEPDEMILDPFMGTGTTLVAAKYSQRRAVGIEIDERYCEIAANRLRQGVLF